MPGPSAASSPTGSPSSRAADAQGGRPAAGRAADGGPRPGLKLRDAVAMVVGIVVGAGIFRTPSIVAANTGGPEILLLAWALGGAMSLVGALCYAELATTYPSAGGDYHFLRRAFGRDVSFLFAWSRMTVVQTGSIALLAFVFGDYAAELGDTGARSSAVYAALAVAGLTTVNVLGVRQGTWTQNVLTVVEVGGLLALALAGLVLAEGAPEEPGAGAATGSFGLAMVFVLLTYGGWNEAAFLSAEVRRPQRNLPRALLLSIGIVTGLYLLVNLAYVHGLGIPGMAGSDTVAADLMRLAGGDRAAWLIGALVAVSALTSANASTFTGARAAYALGRDVHLLRVLGRWRDRAGTPRNALLAQGAIALALVVLGSATREGFETLVEYTAPVFWLFFLLTGISLVVLRVRDPGVPRPFRVPAYPLTPILFCATSAYLLYSSLAYTGIGALVGVAVLATGVVARLATRRRGSGEPAEHLRPGEGAARESGTNR